MTHILLPFFILSLTIASAQEIGKLRKLLNQKSSHHIKAKIASDLSWNYKDINPDSSFYFAHIALKEARLAKKYVIEAYSLSDIGNYYKRKENYQKALIFYTKSLSVRKYIGKKDDLASCYNQIGLLYKQWEKFDSASYSFSMGLKLLPKNRHIELRMKLLDGWGMTLFHLRNYQKALYAINLSRVLSEQLNDSLSIAQSWQNIGTINQYLGNANLALTNYSKAEIYYEALHNLNGKIEMEINRAAIYSIQGKYRMAESILLKAEINSIEFGFMDNRSTIYLNLAKVYDATSSLKSIQYYKKAYQYALQTEKITTRIEATLGLINHLIKTENTSVHTLLTELKFLIFENHKIEYYSQYYELLTELSKINGDYEKAFNYSQKASSSQEEIFNQAEKANDLLTSLEIADKEQKLLKEQLKRKKTESKIQSIQIGVMAGIIIFLIILILIIKKNQRLSRERKIQALHHQSEINELIHESELKFLENSLELEENIRKKIGRDLHDDLGSKLAVAQMNIDALTNSVIDPNMFPIKLKEISFLLEKSCTDLRVISHKLVGEELRNNSLNNAVENICNTLPEQKQFKIQFTSIGQSYPLSLKIKKNLLATIRLLIDNIIKHSEANNASLQVFYHSDSINIEIEDNGKGFDTQIDKINGIGLKNAHQRIIDIGGNIEINSQKNVGTSVFISIPLTI